MDEAFFFAGNASAVVEVRNFWRARESFPTGRPRVTAGFSYPWPDGRDDIDTMVRLASVHSVLDMPAVTKDQVR
jgi:hypothetical protein